MAKTAALEIKVNNDISECLYSVYCFINKKNSKKYIGITSNIDRRYRQHKSGRNRCPVFSSAIKKYGFDNFDFSILKSDLRKQEAESFEKKFILDFNTLVPNGYNRTEGGNSSVKHSEETIRLISEKNKEYIVKNGHSFAGKKHSEESKQLIRISALKRDNYPSGENHWNYGKKANESTVQKLSISNSLGKNPFAKKVVDLNTGIVYSCINEAKEVYNISHSFISMVCSGKRKSNKYRFMYLKDYEKKGSLVINI